MKNLDELINKHKKIHLQLQKNMSINNFRSLSIYKDKLINEEIIKEIKKLTKENVNKKNLYDLLEGIELNDSRIMRRLSFFFF